MKQVRMSLLENAYDFLNEALRSAARAGEDPQAWKFAVLHVVQAIELLLKARLQAEHHVLIYEDIDRRTKTVSLTRAVDRITGAARIELTRRELRSIRKARTWRDLIVHYEFELSVYEVESVFVQLYEFLVRFHDEHTDFGVLHTRIDESLWEKEAEIMAFFRQEFVVYNGVQVSRDYPAEIAEAQHRTTIELHGQTFERTRFGDEIGWPSTPAEPCGDCAVLPGQLHVENCDVEECPRCFWQLITCGCLWGEGPAESDLSSREVAAARRAELVRMRADPFAIRPIEPIGGI
jgi:HEPN domain-containing protein